VGSFRCSRYAYGGLWYYSCFRGQGGSQGLGFNTY
jgi:hypothetical protein